METLTGLKPSSFSCQFTDCSSRFSVKSHFLTTWPKGRTFVSVNRRNLVVRASSSTSPIAPVRLESPVGQFLAQILVSHPHLVPAAAEQQLEQLQSARDAEERRDEPSTSGTELILYRRIAEVKDKERRRALEEILYALVVQKFVEANLLLVPPLNQSVDPSGRVDTWPSKEENLKRVHSPEVLEMIKTYLSQVLGTGLNQPDMIVAISKIQAARLYAASVLFGYFLKRVDQRYQLEKSLKTLPTGLDHEDDEIKQAMPGGVRSSAQIGDSQPGFSSRSSTSFSTNVQDLGDKPSRLWVYVMTFDPDTTRRYVTIRSNEAFAIIEKQTEALFGKPDVLIAPPGGMNSSKDELIKISIGGLESLMLEAVTFGSFLWDVESYVDSRYHFVSK